MPFLVVPFPPGSSWVGGKSVSEYIRRLRLERSASRLKLGKEQVTQIAFDGRVFEPQGIDERLQSTAMLRHMIAQRLS